MVRHPIEDSRNVFEVIQARGNVLTTHLSQMLFVMALGKTMPFSRLKYHNHHNYGAKSFCLDIDCVVKYNAAQTTNES